MEVIEFTYPVPWILKVEGNLTIRKDEFSEDQGAAKFSDGDKFSRATMFLCKIVISVAAFLLIIHITIYLK